MSRLRGAAIRRAFAVAATLLVIGAACGSGRSEESEALIPLDPTELRGTNWQLALTDNHTNVPTTSPVTLAIEATQATGLGPCNNYRVPFVIDGTKLTTGQVASQQMACEPQVNAAEHRYFAALEAADHADIEMERLVLTGPGGVRLVYTRLKAHDLLEGTWDITSVNTGDALVSPIAGTSPTMSFQSDGDLVVNTGCNTVLATWKLSGDSLLITSGPSTLKACAEPEGADAQEQSIVVGLPQVRSVDVAPTKAHLLDQRGTIVFVLARPA